MIRLILGKRECSVTDWEPFENLYFCIYTIQNVFLLSSWLQLMRYHLRLEKLLFYWRVFLTHYRVYLIHFPVCRWLSFHWLHNIARNLWQVILVLIFQGLQIFYFLLRLRPPLQSTNTRVYRPHVLVPLVSNIQSTHGS